MCENIYFMTTIHRHFNVYILNFKLAFVSVHPMQKTRCLNPQPVQIDDYKSGICSFSAKLSSLRKRSKDNVP